MKTLKPIAWLIISHAFSGCVTHAYLNIYGEDLRECSRDGMALTGYTRSGKCVDQIDDAGSHHICIDLSSVNTNTKSKGGQNFCQVTGQSNWCDESMACVNSPYEKCPIQNWCVCQWAFASYIEKAGGCDQIQDIVCDAINLEAYLSYKSILDENIHRRLSMSQTEKIASALSCIESRCDHGRIVQSR